MGDGVFEPAHLEPSTCGKAARWRTGAKRSAKLCEANLDGWADEREALHSAGMKTYVAAGAESRLSAVIERRGRGSRRLRALPVQAYEELGEGLGRQLRQGKLGQRQRAAQEGALEARRLFELRKVDERRRRTIPTARRPA